MPSTRYARIAVAALLLAACASQMEPAQRSISDIEAALSTSASDAATYVPEQLTDVRRELGDLRESNITCPAGIERSLDHPADAGDQESSHEQNRQQPARPPNFPCQTRRSKCCPRFREQQIAADPQLLREFRS